MGLDLVYKCGNLELPTRFSMADWRTIDRLRSHLPDAIATLVDVPALGEKATVLRGALLEAVEQIDCLLRDRPELLPYTYQFRCENFVVAGQRIESTFSTGGFSGFHLPGDQENWYGIKAGLDECRLDKMARQPDGTVRVVDQRDLRENRELETSDCGPIKIRKRCGKSSLRSGLAEIREYLVSLPEGAEITKVVG